MKKIDYYIIKKFLGTFLFSIILIICISIVFDFSEKIDDFLEHDAPAKGVVFDYYLNFIPYFVNLYSYLFTFVAVIFFTSRMSAHNETLAILTSGVSFRRLLIPYFISAFIISGFTFFLGGWVIPPANKARINFENTYIKPRKRLYNRHIHRQVEPGLFIYMETYNNSVDMGYKFSMEKVENGKLTAKLIADNIKWDTTINKWKIKNYYIRKIDGVKETVEKGIRKDTALNIYPTDFTKRWNLIETLDNHELSTYIELEKLRGAENIEVYLIEKYNRYASPFSVFVLTLIGASLAIKKSRGGVALDLGIGILLSFTYILFMRFTSQFAISGSINPLLAVWMPNIFFLIVAVFLYRKAPQ